MENPLIEFCDDQVNITVDEKVYGLPAILKAAYSFTDKCYVLFTSSNQGLRVYLSKLDGDTTKDRDIKEIAKSFCNELLEQKMREQVLQETGRIREIITARAFASGNISLESDD